MIPGKDQTRACGYIYIYIYIYVQIYSYSPLRNKETRNYPVMHFDSCWLARFEGWGNGGFTKLHSGI